MDPGDVFSDLSTAAMDYDGSCLLMAVQSGQVYDDQFEDHQWQQPERTHLNDACSFSIDDSSTVDEARPQQYQDYLLWDMNQQELENRQQVSARLTWRPEPELQSGGGSIALVSFYEQPTCDHYSIESDQNLYISTQHHQLQQQLHQSSYSDQLSVGYHGDGSLLSPMLESSSRLAPAVSTRHCDGPDNGLTFVNCRSTAAFPSSSTSTSGLLADEQSDCTTTGFLCGHRSRPRGETFVSARISSPSRLSTFDDCCASVSVLTRRRHHPNVKHSRVERSHLLANTFNDFGSNPFLSTATDVKPVICGYSANSSSGHGGQDGGRASYSDHKDGGPDVVIDAGDRRLRREAAMSSSCLTRFGESAATVGTEHFSSTSSSGLTSSVNCRSRCSSTSFDQSEAETAVGLCVDMTTNGNDVIRRKRRREQNRRAARKCREKKKENVDSMKMAYDKTKAENERLRVEKNKLQLLVVRLQDLMRVHMKVCMSNSHSSLSTSSQGVSPSAAAAAAATCVANVDSDCSVSSLFDLMCD